MGLLRIVSNQSQGFLSHFIQVLYRPKYQVSVYRTIGPLVLVDCIQDILPNSNRGAWWPSVQGLGLRSERSRVRSSRGSPCCVLKQNALTPQKYWFKPRKRSLRPDKTETSFTAGTLSKKRNEMSITTVRT